MTQAYTDRQATQRAKLRVATCLQAIGENVNEYDTIRHLMIVCERRYGPRRKGESSVDYFDRCAGVSPRPRQKYVGKIVEPYIVDVMKRPEWKPEQHLRAADIDALPRQIGTTGSGIGNGVIWSHVDR